MEFKNQYQRPKYDCLLFDLDDTLYLKSSGLAEECGKNVRDYMIGKLGIKKDKVHGIGNLLYKHYGTTMAGLQAIGYRLDHEDYHSYVHGKLPYEKLKPDPTLRNLLSSLPIRKIIFTNADKVHAIKVLNQLGLEDCFEGIICFETLNPPAESSSPGNSTGIFDISGHFFRTGATCELPRSPIVCKPSEEAMELALRIANINPQTCIFFDDSIRNIQSGKSIGLHTVLIGTSQRIKDADHSLESIHNIREAFPELWKDYEIPHDFLHCDKIAVQSTVIA